MRAHAWLSLPLAAACSSAPPRGPGPTAAPVASPDAPAPAPAAPAVRFPDLVTDDLNGDRQEIPASLPGQLKLFLIAYQREQQADLAPWLTIGLGLERRHPGFRVYELPTLAARWQLARGWIDDGMRSGIQDRAARARTLTLYLDKDAFNRALALPDDRTVYALLVDANGDVVWRQAGRPDDATAATLGREVAARLGAPR